MKSCKCVTHFAETTSQSSISLEMNVRLLKVLANAIHFVITSQPLEMFAKNRYALSLFHTHSWKVEQQILKSI